jgi:hypothetical protein
MFKFTALKRFPKWAQGPARWKLTLVSTLAAIVLLAPRASGQFGLDPCCAIVTAGLNTVSGLLKNVVATPLSTLRGIRQQAADFEQQVVYPLAALDRARQTGQQLQSQLQQMTRLYRISLNSASLAAPQKLEQSLLSGDPQAIAQVGDGYASVYGKLMVPGDAPPAIRDVVDMSDAEAQAAFKKAIEIDALAAAEMAAANSINQQLQSAAPGSAAILEAQAAAWVVRANAYTQSAVAELTRLRSIELAEEGEQLKQGAANLDLLRGHTSQVLGQGAR